MSAEGLRSLLSEAGLDETVINSVMRTVDDYLAKPETPPVILYLRKSQQSAEAGDGQHAIILDLPWF